MNRKYCPKCNQYSHSSISHGEWICPYCGHDMTDEPLNPKERSVDNE